jgi:glutathione S-transferase
MLEEIGLEYSFVNVRSDYPHLEQWTARVTLREAVKRAEAL